MDRPTDAPSRRRTWLTRRALLLHLTVLVVVPAFLALFWWQVQRVRQGNTLSWAYVFEWPFFTGYAVYLWWRLVHEQPEPGLRSPARTAGGAAVDAATSVAAATDVPAETSAGSPAPAAGATTAQPDAEAGDDDRELAEYNRYLAALHASNPPKHW